MSRGNPGTGRRIVADEVSVVNDGATLLPPTSVELAAGECLAILGPSGAGKTTLLRVLAGRLRASSGAVAFDAAPLDERRREIRRAVAALIEPPALYPDLTLRDHLRFIGALWASDEAKDPAGRLTPGLGASAIDAFGLAKLQDRFPHELSSGQRQLASLAVTFARPADVLLLDEPEQRLDPDRRVLVGRAMRSARERGAAIAFASHDAGLVDAVATRRLRIGE